MSTSYPSPVALAPDRLRVFAETIALDKDVFSVDLDATGAVVDGPTLITSYTAYEWSGNSAVAAARRAAFVLPFEVTAGSGGKLRVIQQCM